MQLSEAMVARGFGAAQSRAASIRTRILLLAGLALLLAGWLSQFAGAPPVLSTGLMLAGGASVVGGLWWNSRSVRHTTYRPMPFTRQDAVICLLAAVAAAIVLLPLPSIDRSTLAYNPYPAVSMPGFDPILGLVMLAWLAPLLVRTPAG
jgi:energy-coupling factor transport system permease protein